MKLDEVVDMIRGKKGTEVRLIVIPVGAASNSERKTIRIVRDEIKLKESYAYARIIEHLGPDGKPQRLGVIELPSFTKNAPPTWRNSLAGLKEDIAGLILTCGATEAACSTKRSNSPACSSSAARWCRSASPSKSRCWKTRTPALPMTARSSSPSAITARPPRRSLPPPCRTTAARLSWATSTRTARARCKRCFHS